MRDHVRLALMMAMTAMFTLAGYELMRSASTVLLLTQVCPADVPEIGQLVDGPSM